MDNIGYIQDHDLLKVPDAVLLRESRKENKKLLDEITNLNLKVNELYDKLEKAQGIIENINPISKEDIMSLKLDEMYIRQRDENTILQKRLSDLRKYVDKSVWKNLKINPTEIYYEQT
jgi:hypothetical protein